MKTKTHRMILFGLAAGTLSILCWLFSCRLYLFVWHKDLFPVCLIAALTAAVCRNLCDSGSRSVAYPSYGVAFAVSFLGWLALRFSPEGWQRYFFAWHPFSDTSPFPQGTDPDRIAVDLVCLWSQMTFAFAGGKRTSGPISIRTVLTAGSVLILYGACCLAFGRWVVSMESPSFFSDGSVFLHILLASVLSRILSSRSAAHWKRELLISVVGAIVAGRLALMIPAIWILFLPAEPSSVASGRCISKVMLDIGCGGALTAFCMYCVSHSRAERSKYLHE